MPVPSDILDANARFCGASLAASHIDDEFRAIFDAVNDGIFVSDPASGKLIEVNAHGCAMFGYTRLELIGHDLSLLSSGIHPYTLEAALATSKSARPGDAHIYEWQCKTKAGNLFWAEISKRYTRIGALPANISVVRDITERKRLDSALQLALQKISATSDAKSTFLANMSHELRTPLNAIIGFSDMMLRQNLGPLGDPRYREYIGDIHNSGTHLLKLINDILELSRLDAGMATLAEEEVCLKTVIGEACRMVELQARKSRLQIVQQSAAGSCIVRADERRIRQIILNLLSNAVKFTPAGGVVTVETGISRQELILEVRDTGIGIAPEDLEKVQKRFGQVDSGLSRKYEGTGLGLPLARQLAELHGCRFGITSERDVGTCVTVAFPPFRVVHTAVDTAA